MSNSISNTRIAKNTILLYVRSAFILLINLYTSRVVLEVLGVKDYGIYNLVGGIVGMFSMIGSTLSAASQRFITYSLGKNDITLLKTVFSTSVTLHVLLGLVLIILLEIIGLWMLNTRLNIPQDRLNVALWVFQFSLLTFLINLISVPYNALIIAHEKMSAFAYISIVDAVLKLGTVYVLMIGGFDKLFIYAFLHFLVAIIIRLVYTLYSRSNFIEARKISFNVHVETFREMFAFSSWNFIGSTALVLRNQGIDILLNIFFGVVVNAAKGIAYQVQGAIQLFIGNFTTAINPQLTKAIANNDYNRASNLMFHGGRISFFMMMMIAVPFISCADIILDIWLVESPNYAVQFVQLTIIMLLNDTLTRLLKNGILAYGKIKRFQLTAGSVKLFSLPLTYMFLYMGGNPYTGFIVNIFIEFIGLFIELYFANKFLNFNIKRYILRAVTPCWLTFIISLSIPILCKCYIIHDKFLIVIISLLSAICCIMMIIDKKETSLVLKPIKAKFLKK